MPHPSPFVATLHAIDLRLLGGLGVLPILLFDVRFADQSQETCRAFEQREHLTAAVVATAQSAVRHAIRAGIEFTGEIEGGEAQGAMGRRGVQNPLLANLVRR